MCHRISPLLIDEARQTLEDLRTTGRSRVARRRSDAAVPDAYPGKQVPLFVVGEDGELEAELLTWGFDATMGGASKLVFNTRLETAMDQLRSRRGLWARAMADGRCLVPVRGFYETFTKAPTREERRDVRFSMPGRPAFLLAGVREGERFSIVTTVPNADVLPVHTRMPLVLGPGESSAWLGGDFDPLVNRAGVRLARE